MAQDWVAHRCWDFDHSVLELVEEAVERSLHFEPEAVVTVVRVNLPASKLLVEAARYDLLREKTPKVEEHVGPCILFQSLRERCFVRLVLCFQPFLVSYKLRNANDIIEITPTTNSTPAIPLSQAVTLSSLPPGLASSGCPLSIAFTTS